MTGFLHPWRPLRLPADREAAAWELLAVLAVVEREPELNRDELRDAVLLAWFAGALEKGVTVAQA